MTGDITFNDNIRLEYSTTHHITPRDTSGNMHLSTTTGGIYLDSPVIYIREKGSESNKITIDNGTLVATGNVSGANLSGTNTGDQTLPTLASLGAQAAGSYLTSMSTVLPTSGNYQWAAATTAGNYTTGLQLSFVRGADGWPEYGSVLHVGGRGGSDAGGDYQIYCGHGSANGGNHLRFRNADNSAATTDAWTAFKTIWDSENLVNNQGNWNTAYGWGDHASAGYTSNTGTLTNSNDRNYITDTRGAARAPSYYDDRYAQWDFQNYGDTGVGGDGWHALLTVSKWSSFDASHRQEQLIFSGDHLWRRTATSDSAWGTNKKILDSSNYSSYALPKSGGTMSGTISFPSGAAGSTFAANNYSMGIDIADGAWTSPHYSDLIIGYHTGIRLGAAYSGIRFYNNSPTTDTDNTGNGNGGEGLIMTVGGAAGSTNVLVAGTMLSSNFSGTSSGTNTGDQTLSSLGALSTTGKAADSELLDGMNSDRFVSGTGANKINDSTNFNNSVPSGFYQSSGASNMPGSGWHNMMNVRHSNTGNDHGFQIAASYYNEHIYSRTYSGGSGANDGTFTAWAKQWHNRNDGAGSGLDADLLDGVQGASFLRSDANDTATGIISITNSTASTSKTTGALKVTGGVGIAGALNVGGDIVAYASSDERLKDNIELISNPIEKVQSLKV